MKVVSINSENTVGFKQIAFNVDEELTPEFVSKINYGVLRISGSGTVLVVQLPPDADPMFTSESVKSLNRILSEVDDELAQAAAKRQRMLETIAHNTGLPLA